MGYAAVGIASLPNASSHALHLYALCYDVQVASYLATAGTHTKSRAIVEYVDETYRYAWHTSFQLCV